jgi:hypothetical protein
MRAGASPNGVAPSDRSWSATAWGRSSPSTGHAARRARSAGSCCARPVAPSASGTTRSRRCGASPSAARRAPSTPRASPPARRASACSASTWRASRPTRARRARRPRGLPRLRAERGRRRQRTNGRPERGPRPPNAGARRDPDRLRRGRARRGSDGGAGPRRAPRGASRNGARRREPAASRMPGGPRARDPPAAGGRMTISGQIAVVGVHEYESRFAPDKTEFQIMAECAREALADAGLTLADVDGLLGASMTMGAMGMVQLAEYLNIKPALSRREQHRRLVLRRPRRPRRRRDPGRPLRRRDHPLRQQGRLRRDGDRHRRRERPRPRLRLRLALRHDARLVLRDGRRAPHARVRHEARAARRHRRLDAPPREPQSAREDAQADHPATRSSRAG